MLLALPESGFVHRWQSGHRVKRRPARACALAASSARLRSAEVVSHDRRSLLEAAVISSTAARNAPSLPFDGLLKPLTFLTNCKEAERISSCVTGGSKLNSILMFLHMSVTEAIK